MIPLRDNLSCKTFPYVTLTLLLLNCVAWAIELSLGASEVRPFMSTWAIVPGKVTEAFTSGDPAGMAMAVLSFFTAMFLHGSWMHLIGNMVFLQAFGKAVEARLGSFKFLLFYLLTGATAWLFHFITEPTSMTPALGASGAIAGVLGGYLLFWPKAQFRSLAFMGPVPVLITISAFWLLPAWFATQLIPGFSGLADPSAADGVAYWAHIGGFVGGFAGAALWQFIKPDSKVCYVPIKCDCQSDCAGKHKKKNLRFWEQ